MPNVSGSQLALVLVFAVAQGFLGYLLAEADRRNLGRAPWGLPSVVWALIWFLNLILGLVLWFIAHRTEVRRAARSPMAPPVGLTVPAATPMRASASDFPAYPRPADGSTREPTPTPPPPPAAGAPVVVSPPAWQPDPGGRFHYRWWSGAEWTSYVSIDGVVQIDTSPDQRIGPY